MNWDWASMAPAAGSSKGIQRLTATEDEDLTSFSSITAIDPGGSTGICTVWYWPGGLGSAGVPMQKCLLAWEAACLYGSENEQTLQVLKWIAERSQDADSADLVIEDFILRSAIKGRELLSPVRLTAALTYQLWRGIKIANGKKTSFEPWLQSSNDAKNVMTDNRLKLMAMYTPGPDHARDATRHALMWLRKHRVDLLKMS